MDIAQLHFVGVDAANNTMLNTGRMLINLKATHGNQDELMHRLRQRVRATSPGVTLYLQPTQDLTIDAETGPTQYRVSLEGADTTTVNDWADKLAERLAQRKELRNVVTDAGATGAGGLRRHRPRHRRAPVASRPRSIDDALYSAFGQRIVSTIFTETNQYRVILEAQPDAHAAERAGHAAAAAPAPASRRRCRRSPRSASSRRRCRSRTWRSSRPPPSASTPRPACRWARRSTRSARRPRTIKLPAGVTMTFLGAAGAYERR